MDNYTKLKTEQGELIKEFKTLDEVRNAAKRSFTAEEKTRLGEIEIRLAELVPEIATEETARNLRGQAALNISHTQEKKETEESKSLRGYSILNVMRARHGGENLGGVEAEWQQEVIRRNKGTGAGGAYAIPAEALMRDYTATGTTTATLDQGGLTVPTDQGGLIEALGDRLIANEVGARRLTNLNGNLELPRELTKAEAAWETETSAANDMAGLFDTVTLSPKRIAGYINYTMQMLVQSSLAMEQYSRDRLLDAVARGVNKAFFIGTGANNQPTGVITSTLATGLQSLGGQVAETAGVLDWDSIVDLETLVDTNNALFGSLSYVTNGRGRGALKTAAKGASTNDHYLWDTRDPGNPINGYPIHVTNAIPNTAGTTPANGTATPIIFGNWDYSVLASWGDIFMDSVNKDASLGTYQLVVNSFWDVGVLNAKAFAANADIITTNTFGS